MIGDQPISIFKPRLPLLKTAATRQKAKNARNRGHARFIGMIGD